jgi:hypothetical protein
MDTPDAFTTHVLKRAYALLVVPLVLGLNLNPMLLESSCTSDQMENMGHAHVGNDIMLQFTALESSLE